MCEDCFQELIYKFPTYQDFDGFENVVQTKCNEGKLIILDKCQNDYLAAFDSNVYYECSTCKEIWVLSIPDNAWRGYFLPEAKAIEYKREIKRFDKKRSIGCFLILTIIIIAVIWNFLHR
jgi:hypothetical protein